MCTAWRLSIASGKFGVGSQVFEAERSRREGKSGTDFAVLDDLDILGP